MTDLSHYHRNLPHWLPAGEHFFITFRLAGSLPYHIIEALRATWAGEDARQHPDDDPYTRQKRYFGRYDHLLDADTSGPLWLRQPEIAQLVGDALHFYDGRNYDLLSYCLMPNHVHAVLFLPEKAVPLAKTLQSLKGYTAQKANRLLGLSGQFWHRETYDHIIRNAGEMARIISYVVENPVKAGLVTDWQQWPYTYCK